METLSIYCNEFPAALGYLPVIKNRQRAIEPEYTTVQLQDEHIWAPPPRDSERLNDNEHRQEDELYLETDDPLPTYVEKPNLPEVELLTNRAQLTAVANWNRRHQQDDSLVLQLVSQLDLTNYEGPVSIILPGLREKYNEHKRRMEPARQRDFLAYAELPMPEVLPVNGVQRLYGALTPYDYILVDAAILRTIRATGTYFEVPIDAIQLKLQVWYRRGPVEFHR